MTIELIGKLQRNKKKCGIYLIRRLDGNPKGQPHSYCVTLFKKDKNQYENAIKVFDECVREFSPKGSEIKYENRMLVIRTSDEICHICIEAYKKNANCGGYMEDGVPMVYFLHRMGVEAAILRLKKYSLMSWRMFRTIYYEDALDEIKGHMSDPWFAEKYPNHADRFIAIYNYLKECQKYKPNYINGIL